MRIPNAERAVIAIEKLRDYLLDPASRTRKFKGSIADINESIGGNSNWISDSSI
jgi:hypothetical protein